MRSPRGKNSSTRCAPFGGFGKRYMLRRGEISGGFFRRRSGGVGLQFARRESSEDRREFDAKYGATFRPVVAKNASAVFLDDAEANAQAEPGAFSHGLGGVKGIEHAVRVLDSGA